jgi:hypothetical protein
VTTETDIANLALGRIKQGAIEDLSEDSAEAEAAARLYPIARNFVLADFPWRVCTVIQILTEQTNDREDDWAFKYQRPTCLKFRHMLMEGGRRNPRQAIPYELNQAGIYTDVENARGQLTVLVTDTTLYSPALSSCIAWKLAAELVMPLEADLNLMAWTERKYRDEKMSAWATDASEDMTMDDGSTGLPEFIAIRGG